MFSGIIQATGTIKNKRGKGDITELEIECFPLYEKLQIGDSIAVNGVCLTIEGKKEKCLFVSITKFTENETNLGQLKIRDVVNLEPPLILGDKISGHFLTGHIDFKTKISSFIKSSQTGKIVLDIPQNYRKYFVNKGSIGIDGISLTISEIKGNRVEVNIIPYTIENTNLKYKKTGDIVNIEIDILAKYIDALR
ncbi:MAG TPA: riboflavin synthase [Candidatus Ratteibacteria bacterium]|nr:riboflavin synthase [bacterium]HRR97035.1 riboflavin synthase [Candidatus Ratteibacteria bacterium]